MESLFGYLACWHLRHCVTVCRHDDLSFQTGQYHMENWTSIRFILPSFQPPCYRSADPRKGVFHNSAQGPRRRLDISIVSHAKTPSSSKFPAALSTIRSCKKGGWRLFTTQLRVQSIDMRFSKPPHGKTRIRLRVCPFQEDPQQSGKVHT